MATSAAKIEFVPDEPEATAIDFIPDEEVIQEGQKATLGAIQTLDVMGAPAQVDWSDVNNVRGFELENETRERHRVGQISDPEAMALYRRADELRGITPEQRRQEMVNAQELAYQDRVGGLGGNLLGSILGAPLQSQLEPTINAAARNLGAATGGAGGAAMMMAPAAGPAGVLFPLIGGYLGARFGGGAQEQLTRATETPEETAARQASVAQEAAENPVGTTIGNLASTLPFFRPSPSTIMAAGAGNRAAMKNLGAAAGIGGGSEVAIAAAEGRPIEVANVLGAGIANMLMSEPTRLGRAIGFPATHPAQVAENAVYGLREVPEIPIGPQEGSGLQQAGRAAVESGLANRGATSTSDVFANVQRRPTNAVQEQVPNESVLRPTETGQEGVELPTVGQGDAVAPEAQAGAQQTPEVVAGVEFTPEPPTTPPEAPSTPEHPVNPESVTSIKNAQTAVERQQRGIAAAEEPARRAFGQVWDEAKAAAAENPSAPDVLISELKKKPRSLTDLEDALLLRKQIELQNAYDSATEAVNAAADAGDDAARTEAIGRLNGARDALSELYDINKKAGTETGRGLSARRMMAQQDFTLSKMETEFRASQGGEPLTESQLADVRKQFETISNTQKELDARIASLESQKAGAAVDEVIAKSEASVDPVVKSLADRIIGRLDVASSNAAKSLRSRLQNLGSAPDPLIVLDVAKIAAAKAAKGAIKFGQWSAEMIKEFGEKVRPFLQAGWDQREQHIDSMVESIGGTKKKDVGARVKKTAGNVYQVARIDAAIGNRIKEGKPLSALGPYVKRLAEQFVKSGINQREPLIDAVHQSLASKMEITREQARDLISGYGESSQLSKEPAKVTLRDLKGQMQQVAKLEALQARVPLQKTGPERRTPSAEERMLIKQVNDAKKELGVVVTDPETQLKSTMDSVRTRLRNEIEEMTLEIETGERRPDQTPVEYTQDIEILKGVRDRIRETLDSLEPQKGATPEQQVASAKRGLEASISALERRLAGDKRTANKKASTPEIEALRAKRDALKAEADALDAADATLQEEKKAQNLVRQIEATENALTNNATKAKVQGADTQLVAEAKAQLKSLREQLQAKRNADHIKEAERIAKAEETLEASIRKLDEDLQSGRVDPKAKPTQLQSERLDYLRAQRDAMVKLRDQIRNEAKPRMSREELAVKARKTFLTNQTADLLDRTARGDFAKRERVPVDISKDPEAVRIAAKNAQAKEQFAQAKHAAERAGRSAGRKAWEGFKDTVDAATNFLTSLDLSALRQGMIAAISHPIIGTKNVGKMIQAFGSERKAREINQAIMMRPNAQNGKDQRAGLAITPLEGGSFTAREENMGAKMAEMIPGVRMSNRAFVTFLNKMRADTFDALVDMAGPNPTREQLQALGSFVNVATGRGDFGKFAGAVPLLGRVLWSPRLLLSRIQYLTGTPFLKGDAMTRKIIGKEYARFLTGIAGIYTLTALGKMATGGQIDVGTDPRSSDFGKIIVGNTRIDPLGGLAQVVTLAGRLFSGETKSTKGKVRSLTDKQSMVKTDAGDVLGKFFRSKLNPVAGTSWDIISRRLYDGKPTTIKDVAVNALVPLSLRDIPENVREEGAAKALGLWLLNTFGISARSYEPK